MDFSKLDGLIPAVIQDDASHEVLMVGFMNQDALDRTIQTGFATFFSRTRGRLWTKGETSGNQLQVTRLFVDCDDDTLLVKVKRLGEGNVCHTGERSCFYREYSSAPRSRSGSSGSDPECGPTQGGESGRIRGLTPNSRPTADPSRR
jgi:phosphoribosyl-ATP pyrophosphohydrolase/phosphoribosyl-AMP cyclohydrolase